MSRWYGFRTVATLPDGTGRYRTRTFRCAEGMTRKQAEACARLHAGPLPFVLATFRTREDWLAYPGTGYASRPSASAPWRRARWIPMD